MQKAYARHISPFKHIGPVQYDKGFMFSGSIFSLTEWSTLNHHLGTLIDLEKVSYSFRMSTKRHMQDIDTTALPIPKL